MQTDCEECRKLWRDYEELTTAYLEIKGKLQVAEITKERETSALLRIRLRVTEEARAEFREAIRRHDESEHADKATGASASS
jgi:hypothetical protein